MEINQGTVALVILAVVMISFKIFGEKQYINSHKVCSQCDESIKIKANICKHCGSQQ